MSKKEYTNYQKDVIFRYYHNLDAIMLGKLQELVTELYLAEDETKQKRLWDRAHKAMLKLKVKPGIVRHIMKTRSVIILAKNVEDWIKLARSR